MPRTPTADVTITLTVELPNRTLTESIVVPLPAAAGWDGPLGCAEQIRSVADQLVDHFRLTLPEEWAVYTVGAASRAVRAVRRVLRPGDTRRVDRAV